MSERDASQIAHSALAAPRAFLASVRRSRDRLGAAIAIAMCAYALCALSVALCPSSTRFWMERFHLRTHHFVLWAAAQPSPWMYNFENYALTSDRALTSAQLKSPPEGLRWEGINHQPARVFTYADRRARYLLQPGNWYFYLESRYRGLHYRSAYRVEVLDDATPGARPAKARAIPWP